MAKHIPPLFLSSRSFRLNINDGALNNSPVSVQRKLESIREHLARHGIRCASIAGYTDFSPQPAAVHHAQAVLQACPLQRIGFPLRTLISDVPLRVSAIPFSDFSVSARRFSSVWHAASAAR